MLFKVLGGRHAELLSESVPEMPEIVEAGQCRRLPAFDRLKEERDTAEMPAGKRVLKTINGIEGKGYATAYEWLGHGNGAAGVNPGDSLVFRHFGELPDSTYMELRLLPTHPASGKSQRFRVTADGQDLGVHDLTTQGRSEEWKENVLGNQAVCRIALPPSSGEEHSICILPEDNLLIVDQLILSR